MPGQSYISRLTIEDGFLDGLDLDLRPGLNAIIGPRGCGKTSIIELIRYCFGIEATARKRLNISVQQAEAILAGGRVIVHFFRDGIEYVASRVAGQPAEDLSVMFLPLILSQNEIEGIGLDASSRLALVDGFLEGEAVSDEIAESSIVSHVGSTTREIMSVRIEIDRMRSQTDELPELSRQYGELVQQQERLGKDLAAARLAQDALNQEGARAAQIRATIESRSRMFEIVREYAKQFSAIVPLNLERYGISRNADPPLFASVDFELRQAASDLEAARVHVAAAVERINLAQLTDQASYDEVDERMREMRRGIESVESGSSAHARRLQTLREQIATREVQIQQIAQLENDVVNLERLRELMLDDLDSARRTRFARRREISEMLNRRLSPQIRISVEQSGTFTAYASLLTGLLRGSRLHLSKLIPIIVSTLMPRELIQLIESGNVREVREALGISADRARNFIDSLRSVDLGELLTVRLEDRVVLELLDGTEYKSTETLSTGQRCTVVLPILVERTGIPLIIDQPEDHLDNAFIVDTLIRSITQRAQSDQIIVATHNANIPVLGNAHRVVVMASDGKHGFVKSAAELESEQTVRAITSIMEGGSEAFSRRARFYSARSYQ